MSDIFEPKDRNVPAPAGGTYESTNSGPTRPADTLVTDRGARFFAEQAKKLAERRRLGHC